MIVKYIFFIMIKLVAVLDTKTTCPQLVNYFSICILFNIKQFNWTFLVKGFAI